MKFFLAREHHPNQSGMEAIRAQLSSIIRSENPDTPYSDEQLAQLMAHDGVFMTDELVERLREELHIPDSDHRIFYDPQQDCEDEDESDCCEEHECSCGHEHHDGCCGHEHHDGCCGHEHHDGCCKKS